ncbi:uncharacterized protein LOC106662118 [Cimex lectularius]|uniref:Cuticular protein analogous to peritophin n=1 Tax=Cimex lectularius TaxID=79782 RepID=A0A8I6R8W8_CIMLE|nr:uncharacterized protein LOC106662118 [Cimex lectularius]
MLLATLTLLVAGVTVSTCFSCEGPGVVPAPHPNKFVFCTYNEDGDLVARLLPCSDGTTFTGNDKWEMLSKQDCVVRRRRDVDGLETSQTENKTESVLKELSTETNLQTEGEDSTGVKENKTESVLKELSTETNLQTEGEDSTGAAEKVTSTAEETEAQTDKLSTGTQASQTDDQTEKEAATTENAEESSDSPTTGSASAEPSSESTTMTPNSNETKHVECWYPGVTCASCTEAAFCVGTGTLKNGQRVVTPVTTITCRPGEVCVEMLGCVSDKNRFCTKGEFTCTDQGLFPDPYDCRMFHSCAFLNGAFLQDDVRCLAGAYSSKTGTCGYPLNSATCLNKPVPHCKQEFEVGAVPSNPNLYYVCVKKGKTLSPSLFRCPGGRKFTTALFRCVP